MIFKKLPTQQGGNITISYKDEYGKELDSSILQGAIGEEIDIEVKDISNYTYDKEKHNKLIPLQQ